MKPPLDMSEEEPPPTSPKWSRRIKPPPDEGGEAMRRRLELPTSCMREGGGAMWLEGEANLP
jgi:hypothetical protein